MEALVFPRKGVGSPKCCSDGPASRHSLHSLWIVFIFGRGWLTLVANAPSRDVPGHQTRFLVVKRCMVG